MADRRRLGTDNLRMAISDVLAETIRRQCAQRSVALELTPTAECPS